MPSFGEKEVQSRFDIRLLFDPLALSAARDDERRTAYGHALRIENPTLDSPETIDCATCHIAMAARRFAERAHGLSSLGAPDLYTRSCEASSDRTSPSRAEKRAESPRTAR